MGLKIKILRNVIDRLAGMSKPCQGCMFGTVYDDSLLVLALHLDDRLVSPERKASSIAERASRDTDSDEASDEAEDGSRCRGDQRFMLPAEVDLCGFFSFEENLDDQGMSALFLNFKDVEVTDNAVLLSRSTDDKEVKCRCLLNEKLVDAVYDVVDVKEVQSKFILVRVCDRVKITSDVDRDSIVNALEDYRQKVSNGFVAFKFAGHPDFLSTHDGWFNDDTCEDMLKYQNDGQKKDNAKNQIVVLNTELFTKVTRHLGDDEVNRRPLKLEIYHKFSKYVELALQVDALALVRRTHGMARVYGILLTAVSRHLQLVKCCFCEQLDGDEITEDFVPETFHFLPEPCGHFITTVYARCKTTDQLLDFRKQLHEELDLPMNRPFFRRTCAYKFGKAQLQDTRLVNPHLSISSSGLKNSEPSLVQGQYSYYHYLQDNMDDDGWGCAYRSLQTICSWYRWQGYIEREVPTIWEIQKCLVDIGDKPASFNRSRSWIGSMEVSFVLESLLGITSRILRASSGEEVASFAYDLAAHFKSQGTPVMIGGGELAHTILGIDCDTVSNEVKFLILDPHYTGKDNLETILSKGWCGWKSDKFWKKSVFYNMCLPRRPNVV